MTSVWADTTDGQWQELTATGFALESELQGLVFRSIGMLPLAGRPTVVALAREVEMNAAKARGDVLGVEASGTPVLIEVKLSHNQEARKAVVAQVLSYAASLRGTSTDLLLSRITAAGFGGPSIAQAVA